MAFYEQTGAPWFGREAYELARDQTAETVDGGARTPFVGTADARKAP